MELLPISIIFPPQMLNFFKGLRNVHEHFLDVSLIDWQKLPSLEGALYKINSSDPAAISAVIDEYSQQPPLKATSAYLRLEFLLFLAYALIAKGSLSLSAILEQRTLELLPFFVRHDVIIPVFALELITQMKNAIC